MCSGSDVVTAATIPPVGANVSAFSVISERRTADWYRPSYVQPAIQLVPHACVSAIIWRTASGGGVGWWDGYHVSENGTDWPVATSKSANVARSWLSMGAVVRSVTASGPAIAVTVCS